jgi:hypothetical protein
VTVLPASNGEELRQAMRAMIARGNLDVPMLRRREWPPPVTLKYAKVKTWSAFELLFPCVARLRRAESRFDCGMAGLAMLSRPIGFQCSAAESCFPNEQNCAVQLCSNNDANRVAWTWLGREDSNLRMAESKSAALPLGYAPMRAGIAGGRCRGPAGP